MNLKQLTHESALCCSNFTSYLGLTPQTFKCGPSNFTLLCKPVQTNLVHYNW